MVKSTREQVRQRRMVLTEVSLCVEKAQLLSHHRCLSPLLFTKASEREKYEQAQLSFPVVDNG